MDLISATALAGDKGKEEFKFEFEYIRSPVFDD